MKVTGFRYDSYQHPFDRIYHIRLFQYVVCKLVHNTENFRTHSRVMPTDFLYHPKKVTPKGNKANFITITKLTGNFYTKIIDC